MESPSEYSLPASKVTFEERPIFPLITICLALASLVVFYIAGSNTSSWSTQHCFQTSVLYSALSAHQYNKILEMWLYSNLAALFLWQLIGNLYFLCLFGVEVEKRLGSGRFILLVLMGSFLPWIVQAWEAANPAKMQTVFLGSSLLTFTILGAYLVLAPNRAANYSRQRFRVLNVKKPPSEQFGFHPRVFAIAFLIYALGSHFAVAAFSNGTADTIGLWSALTATFLGFNLASFLIHSALSTGQNDPLKLAAVKHYYDLITLDVNPEDALKGAAGALKLPVDQVRRWVSQNKDRLKTS